MPVGVNVTTTPPPGGGALTTGDSRTLFLAGITERGDTSAPIVCRSLAEAIDLTGARVTTGSVYDQIAAYFGESGNVGRVVVARAVGPGATKAQVVLSDSAGTPVQTLRLTAQSEGAWSANLTVAVTAGNVANTFSLTLTYKGNVVERYLNLASPSAAVTALAASSYIRATDLASATAAPNNNPAPTTVTFPAGSDDTANVTASVLVTALNRIGPEWGPGVAAIPGQSSTAVASGLAAHGQANNRLWLTTVPVGTSTAATTTILNGLRTQTYGEGGGLLTPWVYVPDGAGGTRLVSPEGYAAGRRAQLIDTPRRGVWNAPAGLAGQAQYVVGVERQLVQSEVDSINDAAGIPIRLAPAGPRIYGWRSLSGDEVNYRSLTTRDLLNVVSFRIGQVLESYVETTVDGKGQTLAAIKGAVIRILQPIADQGGLYALGNDPGYLVDVGPTVNTPVTLGRGEVRVRVELRDSPQAEFIRVMLTKVALTSNL